MSTQENYIQNITALNNRMWAEAQPLEKELRNLETEHKAANQRPVTDVIARGAAVMLLHRINTVAAKLNAVYEEWQRNLTLITPPPPTIDPNAYPPPPSPGKASSKIPWPKDLPPEVRRYLARVIDQGGVPISKRVAVKVANAPFGGGPGVVVEFSKW